MSFYIFRLITVKFQRLQLHHLTEPGYKPHAPLRSLIAGFTASLLIPASVQAQVGRNKLCDESQPVRNPSNLITTDTIGSNIPGSRAFLCHDFARAGMAIKAPTFHLGSRHAMPVNFLTVNPPSIHCFGAGLVGMKSFSFETCLFYESLDRSASRTRFSKIIFRPARPYRQEEAGWPIIGGNLAFSSAQSNEIICKDSRRNFVRSGVRYHFTYQVMKDGELIQQTLRTPLIVSRGVKVVPCTPYPAPIIRKLPLPSIAKELSLYNQSRAHYVSLERK